MFFFLNIIYDILSSQDPPAKDHPLIMELHELKTKIFMDIATRPFENPLGTQLAVVNRKQYGILVLAINEVQ